MKILIAEDNESTAKYFKKVVERAGFEAAIAADGEIALAMLVQDDYDAILSDWLMPKINGVNLIKRIRKEFPQPPFIIMITTLTSDDSKNFAIDSGADGFLAKPVKPEELIYLVKKGVNLRNQKKVKIAKAVPTSAPKKSPPPFGAVVIAASTGGPPALTQVLGDVHKLDGVCVYIVQHGPEWMFKSFVKRLNNETHHLTLVGKHNMKSEPGRIYVAPGDYHMTIDAYSHNIKLNKEAPENYVRPAADQLFRSAAAAFGSFCLAVVMTGMGSDGASGAAHVSAAGGKVVIQDPKTCVAPSMPESAIKTKIPHIIAPLDALGNLISTNIFQLAARVSSANKSD